MLKLFCLLAGSAMLAGNLFAAPPAGTTDRLIQNERQQQLLRANIETVSTQLHALIDDYRRNGITSDEVQTLQTIAGILARLTGPEIQRVVELLQAARSATDAGAAQHHILAAYASQKAILVQLRQVVSEYRYRQELQEIADRLIALASRQHANLNLAIAYVTTAPEITTAKPDESRRAVLAAQTTEQDAIGAEITSAIDRLTRFAKQPANADIAERTGKTLAGAKTGNLLPALNAALTGLKAGQILNAAGQEKIVRDQLRHLAQLLTAPSNPADVLRQAAAELDTAIRDQRQVATDTKALCGNDPGKQLVEDRQASLIDRTDTIRAATENLAPSAAVKLKEALTEMQSAREPLRSTNPNSAATAAGKATDKLTEAQTALNTEADRAAQTPAAQLQQVDQQLKNLIGEQERLQQASADAHNTKPLAKQEEQLQQTAQDLQRATALTSPVAAQTLNDAAQHMQRASAKLAAGQNAGPAQQAALDALQQARQQLQPALAQTAQSDQTTAALEKLLDRLASIIRAEQQLQLDTGRATAEPATQTSNLTATDALRPDVAKQNPEAGALLADAGQAMTTAHTAITNEQFPTAQTAEQAALDKLYQAKSLLEQQLAAVAPPAPANPQATATLAQAQQQVGQALEQLTQAGPPSAAMQQAGQALQNAAQTVGEMAASPHTGLPAPAQAPLQFAQQSLAAATAAAACNNPAAATASATAAQSALAKAQAAAAMAAGPEPATTPGQTPPAPGGDGAGNFSKAAPDGVIKEVTGRSAFIGLPARDRQAIKQSQGEKYPEEYGPLIEQYLRNLAEQSSRER